MNFSKKMFVAGLHLLILFLMLPAISSADYMVLNGTLTKHIYDAGVNNYVSSSSCTVNSGSYVTVRANDYIVLKPGFTAAAGSTFHAYTTKSDSDNDGIPDSQDLNPGQNDAFLDTDGDGLSNLEEYENGTNQNNVDSDGDNINDQAEYLTGTDPLLFSDKPPKGNYYTYDALGRITSIVRVN